MPQGVEVQVLSSALEKTEIVPRRLMVGQQPLELFTVVRIHAGQQKESDKMGYGIFTDTCRILRY